MDKIIEALREPSWWFTVVIAGLIINIFAPYLRERLIKKLSLVSNRFRAYRQRRKGRIKAEAKIYLKDKNLLIIKWMETRFELLKCRNMILFIVTFIALLCIGYKIDISFNETSVKATFIVVVPYYMFNYLRLGWKSDAQLEAIEEIEKKLNAEIDSIAAKKIKGKVK